VTWAGSGDSLVGTVARPTTGEPVGPGAGGPGIYEISATGVALDHDGGGAESDADGHNAPAPDGGGGGS